MVGGLTLGERFTGNREALSVDEVRRGRAYIRLDRRSDR